MSASSGDGGGNQSEVPRSIERIGRRATTPVEDWHRRWTQVAEALRTLHEAQVQRKINPAAEDQALEHLATLKLFHDLTIPGTTAVARGRAIEATLLDALRKLRKRTRTPLGPRDLAGQAIICWCLHTLDGLAMKAVARKFAREHLAGPDSKGTGWSPDVREQTVRARMWPRGLNSPRDYLPGTAGGLHAILEAVEQALSNYRPDPAAHQLTPPLDLRVLGAIEVRRPQGQPFRLNAQEARVLGALAASTGQAAFIEALAAQVGDAEASLPEVVERLRMALGEHATIIERDGSFSLEIDPQAVDWRRFQAMARKAHRLLGEGDVDGALDCFEAAERQWQGPPFGDQPEPLTPLLQERRRELQEERQRMVERWASAALQYGRHEALLQRLERWTTEFADVPLFWFLHATAALDGGNRRPEAARAILQRWEATDPSEKGSHLQRRAWCMVELAAAGVPPGPTPTSAEAIADTSGPLIARERELGELKRFLDLLRSGTGGMQLLEGEAGVGKTRLLAELCHLATEADVLMVYLVCADRAASLGPWRQLLGPLWAEALRDLSVGEEMVEDSHLLLDLLIEERSADAPRIPAGEDRRLERLAPLVITIIRHASARRPLLVALDDVHWIDPASLQLIESVQARLADSRIGVVAALRPTVVDSGGPLARWRTRLLATPRPAIEVVPFGRRGVRAWLNTVGGRSDVSDALVQLALDRSGGRALVLEHVSLEPETDDSTAPHLPRETDLPFQVLRGLLPTLERRTDGCRAWLEAAAVAASGQQFDPVMVAKMVPARLRQRADQLAEEARAARILAPDGRRFENILWRDVIAAHLPFGRLRSLHARAYRVMRDRLEQRGASSEEATRLALHAWEGRERLQPREVVAACLAAVKAERRSYAYDSSVVWCERGLDVVEDAGQHYELLVERGDAQHDAGDLAAANRSYTEAGALAAAWGEREREAVAALRSARLWSAPFRANQELSERLEAALEGLDNDYQRTLRTRLEAQLARTLAAEGADLERRELLARSALEVVDQVDDLEVLCEILWGCRWGLYEAAPPAELLELSQRLKGAAARIGSEHLQGEGLMGTIVDLLRLGQLHEARITMEEHHDHARRNRRLLSQYLQHSLESMMALWEGEFDRAWEHVGKMTDVFAPAPSLPYGAEVTVQQAVTAQTGWLLREQGQVEVLKEQESLVVAMVQQAGHIPMWRAALALLYCETGNYRRAAEIVEEIAQESVDFSRFPPHGWAVPTLFLLAEICDELHDAGPGTGRVLDLVRMGRRLRTLLEPHLGEFALGGTPAVLVGPVSRAAGLAALVEGDLDTAIRFLEDASFEATPTARPTQTRLHFDLARAHLARGQVDDRMAAAWQLEQAVNSAEMLGMQRLATRAQELLDRSRL
jgi:hypothetical protein